MLELCDPCGAILFKHFSLKGVVVFRDMIPVWDLSCLVKLHHSHVGFVLFKHIGPMWDLLGFEHKHINPMWDLSCLV